MSTSWYTAANTMAASTALGRLVNSPVKNKRHRPSVTEQINSASGVRAPALSTVGDAPDRLVEATADFGRTSRVPMLWIYIENDTFFGPDLSKRMHQAFTAARGRAE